MKKKRKQYTYELFTQQPYGPETVMLYDIYLSSEKDELWFSTFKDLCKFGLMTLAHSGKVAWLPGSVLHRCQVRWEENNGKER